MRRSLKMEHARQDAYVKKMHAIKHPCPHCGDLLSFADAKTGEGDNAECKECKETIRYTLYLFGGQGFEKI